MYKPHLWFREGVWHAGFLWGDCKARGATLREAWNNFMLFTA